MTITTTPKPLATGDARLRKIAMIGLGLAAAAALPFAPAAEHAAAMFPTAQHTHVGDGITAAGLLKDPKQPRARRFEVPFPVYERQTGQHEQSPDSVPARLGRPLGE